MKVLLISSNTEQLNMPTAPLGLACVAEAAKKAGHIVDMLDLMFQADFENVLENAIKSFNPQCIGISVRNIDDQSCSAPRFLAESVKPVVEACRRLSTAPVVLGGAGYSMFPESLLQFLGADMGIVGEGEVAFPALLAQMEKCSDFSQISGSSQISGLYLPGQTLFKPPVYTKTLDNFPLPEPKLLSSSIDTEKIPFLPVQSRRGCPLKCTYCSTPMIEGTVIRKRSPEHFTDWLEALAGEGFKNFFFVDNTFNLPLSYAKKICSLIIKKKLDIQWFSIIYPGRVDAELVKLMAEAGCNHVSLGFESGADKMLGLFNKHFSVKEVIRASKLFASNGIEQMGFLLLGGPGETRQTVEESLAFVDSIELTSLKITCGIRIYPGTSLAKTARAENVISSGCDLLRPSFYMAEGLENWLPERLDSWQTDRPYVMM